MKRETQFLYTLKVTNSILLLPLEICLWDFLRFLTIIHCFAFGRWFKGWQKTYKNTHRGYVMMVFISFKNIGWNLFIFGNIKLKSTHTPSEPSYQRLSPVSMSQVKAIRIFIPSGCDASHSQARVTHCIKFTGTYFNAGKFLCIIL